MPCYTCITTNRGHTHASQHVADGPESALKKHISEMPFFESNNSFENINPIGDELYWLQSFALGKRTLRLKLVKNCKNTWKWKEGEKHSPSYITHITMTDAGK